MVVLVPKGGRGDQDLGKIFRNTGSAKAHPLCIRKAVTDLFTLSDPDGKD